VTRTDRRVASGLIGLLFGFAGLTGCDPARPSKQTIPSAVSASPPLPAPSAKPLPDVTPSGVPPTFADLAARTDPGVVFIKTREYRGGMVGDGRGSGFVYDSQGHILTNNHVIEHARDITVVIGQLRDMKARVVGRDSLTDVAVLEVTEKNLEYLPLGDSDATRVGDWVIAIGNPFGLTHTVSAGIVSAKGRTWREVEISDTRGYYDFIQTDASINPGNSGGPLLDLRGRVVGINTAIRAPKIVSRHGVVAGIEAANSIGFAIPINMVKDLLPHLMKDGMVRRSVLGVSVGSIQPDDVARLNLPGRGGALVTVVEAGGPADQAGLKVDDVILAFNGRRVETPERLRWVVSLAGVGSRAALHVQRAERAFDLTAKLAELKVPPPEPQLPDDPFEAP
jgi:serine protease Do